MKRIIFKWSGATIHGTIISRKPSPILGEVTEIKADDGITYTLYGKCQVGKCGPFTVLSIE
jgi:hypothetical protein